MLLQDKESNIELLMIHSKNNNLMAWWLTDMGGILIFIRDAHFQISEFRLYGQPFARLIRFFSYTQIILKL